MASGLGTPNAPVLFGDMVADNTLYVDSNAPGPTHDGSSWTDAYTTLSQALTAASGNEEILVSQGSYYPTASSDQNVTFQLKNDVAIYGGYAGYGASNPNAQNAALFPTILSGDIGVAGNPSDNSYHVVTTSYTNSTAILDGLTITQNTTSTESPLQEGSALYNIGGSPTITNCLFTENSGTGGGAVYNSGGADEFINCTFDDNIAEGGEGGALEDLSSANTIIHCTFTDNTATFGGAIYDASSNDTISDTITDCTFTQNSANSNGGASMQLVLHHR